MIVDIISNCLEFGKRVKISQKDVDITNTISKMTTLEAKVIKKNGEQKYVLLDNYLVDVGSYLDNHPGGRNLLEDSLYMDVSRYMIGSVPYNSKIAAFDHSYLTCVYAIKKLAFAELKDDHKIIINLNKESVYINEDGFISNRRVTSGTTSEFTIEVSNKNLSFARYLKGFSWMGKHFSITSRSKNKTRLYSLCLSGNKTIHDKHITMLNNISLLEEGKDIQQVQLSSNEIYNQELQIYIKRYTTPGALSDYLHSSEVSKNDLIIKGPLGLGLDITEDSIGGTYVAFSAGTGIYCFLDLIAYTIRLVAYKIAKERFSCKDNKLTEDESFDEAASDFKLILFCSYPDEINAYWHDLFIKTHDYDKKYSLNKFEYYPRLSNVDKRPGEDYYINALKNITNLKKVFLCGPSSYLDDIKAKLIRNRLAPEESITLI